MNSLAALAAKILGFFAGSVRRRLVLAVVLVHALLMTLCIYDLVGRQREFLHEEALARAESLAGSLAASSASWVLASDLVGLEEVTRTLNNAPGLEYAAVIDPAGRVLAHSDGAYVGRYVSDPVSLGLLGRQPQPQRLAVTGTQIDVAAPIRTGGRMLGWARVGLSQSIERTRLDMVAESGLYYALGAILLGAVMAAFIARRLTSGLEGLVGVVERVRAGERGARADESSPDEIGRLAAGFNAMLRAVREGEEKFRTVADFTHDWEYWRTPDGVLAWMSPSCELYTGHPPEAFLADATLLRRIVHPDDLSLYDAHIAEIEGGSLEPGELDFRIVHKNGQTVWIDHHCQDIARSDGALLGRRVSNRDITLRKHAEEGLRRWAQVFENAAWGIMVCSPDSETLEAMNPAFARMHGYTVAELTGKPVACVYAPEELSRVDEGMLLAHKTGHQVFEALHVRRDGTRFPCQLDVTAVKDALGRVLYRVVNVQDITERRRGREELVRAKEAAEAASQAKSDFLAVMSHELRTPLNGIKGMLQIIREAELSAHERSEYVGHALAASDSLSLILNDLLDVSRIEAGLVRLVEEPFRIEDVVRPVMDILEPAAREKGLGFSLSLDPRLGGHFMGDPGRIRQVLLNLVGNAVKFTEAGEVRLEAYPLHVEGVMDARLVHFAVADTGIGIPHAHLGRVFDPFTQVESPYTRRHGGAGLGLTVVGRLVALMGGRVDIYSEPGAGTEVHMTLPLADAQAPHTRTTLFASAPGQAAGLSLEERPAVLVVEDDLVNLLTATKYLERLGYAPFGARGGAEALRKLAERPFALVLMDIQMPGMDGIETTRSIRTCHDPHVDPAIPIIALTAHAMQGDRERFLAAGMNGYLAKPYRLEELQAAIFAILG